jgi:cyclic pyranopterin phosphate synthase
MPEQGAPVAPKAEILTFEEIERIARIAVNLGMTKIRLTGGEPLVRREIDRLVARIGALPGLRDLSLTTNGFLLERYAAAFARSGLRRVNISLDTLRPERFARIARRGRLQDVLCGIEAAVSAGLSPLKLNCVLMRGWNDDELADFARLTLTRPFDVRFIEIMPINWSTGDETPGESLLSLCALAAPQGYRSPESVMLYANADFHSFRDTFHVRPLEDAAGQLNAAEMRRAFVSTAEARARIEAAYGALEPADVVTNGPAYSYRIPGAHGTIGFISQITNDNCLHCNRLRLTADGQLRPCLMADGEIDLREAIRGGATDDEMADLFRVAVFHKPKEHRLEDGFAPTSRGMSQIGG